MPVMNDLRFERLVMSHDQWFHGRRGKAATRAVMPDAKHAQQTQAQTKVQQRDNQRSFFGSTLVGNPAGWHTPWGTVTLSQVASRTTHHFNPLELCSFKCPLQKGDMCQGQTSLYGERSSHLQ